MKFETFLRFSFASSEILGKITMLTMSMIAKNYLIPKMGLEQYLSHLQNNHFLFQGLEVAVFRRMS